MTNGISRFERAFVERGYWKEAVVCATTGPLLAGGLGYTAAGAGPGKTITMDAAGVLTVDGHPVVLGDRVLVKNEAGAGAIDHGIYLCTTEGTGVVAAILTRAEDMDDDIDIAEGAGVTVSAGEQNARRAFHLRTPNPGLLTIDTDQLLFWLTGEVQRMALNVTYGDLTETMTATPQTFNFPTLPDGAVPIGAAINLTTLFAGGAGATMCTASIGDTGVTGAFVPSANLLGTTGWKDTPGTQFTAHTRHGQGGIVPRLVITPAGTSALSAYTAGALTAYFYYSVAQQ